MKELDERELETVTAGKELARKADATMDSLDRAARSADREINRIGKLI